MLPRQLTDEINALLNLQARLPLEVGKQPRLENPARVLEHRVVVEPGKSKLLDGELGEANGSAQVAFGLQTRGEALGEATSANNGVVEELFKDAVGYTEVAEEKDKLAVEESTVKLGGLGRLAGDWSAATYSDNVETPLHDVTISRELDLRVAESNVVRAAEVRPDAENAFDATTTDLDGGGVCVHSVETKRLGRLTCDTHTAQTNTVGVAPGG